MKASRTSLRVLTLFALSSQFSPALAQTIIEYSGEPARVTGTPSPTPTSNTRKGSITFVSAEQSSCIAHRDGQQVKLDLVPPCKVIQQDGSNYTVPQNERVLFYVLGQQQNNTAGVELAHKDDAFTTSCQFGEIAGNRIQGVFINSNNDISLNRAVDLDPTCSSMALQSLQQ